MKDIYQVDCIERKNYKKYLFSDPQKELIKQLYQNDTSTVDIGKMFNVSHKTIAKVLDGLGMPRIGAGKRIYAINEHYFDEIDTQNKS